MISYFSLDFFHIPGLFQIATSEYLKTIGAKLPKNIDIMWTGDKVIPKEITLASLDAITEALRRPVVIWDNEHANDYDQRRIFLGNFTGI